MNSIIAVIVAL